MRYQVTLQSRDRDQQPFLVEVEAETGDQAAALALARHPGHTASNIFPAGDAPAPKTRRTSRRCNSASGRGAAMDDRFPLRPRARLTDAQLDVLADALAIVARTGRKDVLAAVEEAFCVQIVAARAPFVPDKL